MFRKSILLEKIFFVLGVVFSSFIFKKLFHSKIYPIATNVVIILVTFIAKKQFIPDNFNLFT